MVTDIGGRLTVNHRFAEFYSGRFVAKVAKGYIRDVYHEMANGHIRDS